MAGTQVERQPLHLLARHPALLGQTGDEHVQRLARQGDAVGGQRLSRHAGHVTRLVLVHRQRGRARRRLGRLAQGGGLLQRAGSNGSANPFADGFHDFGYKPPSNSVFPANPPGNAANFQSNFRPGYVQQYTLSYQLGLGANDSLELAYVGTKGTHLAQNYDLNEPVASATASSSNEQTRRPNQGIAILSTEAPIGYSNYSGLQVSYHHRIAFGLDVNSNFSWQKCIDNGSNPGSTGASVAGNIDIDPSNPGFSRGLCDFDQPFNFRNTFVYTTPGLKNRGHLMRTALGAWAVSGNFIFDSGQPFSVTTNGCRQLLHRHRSRSRRPRPGCAAPRQTVS